MTFVTIPIAGAFYRIAVTEWGDQEAPPVLCVHGLTRTGRDFDALAQALAASHHVLCPDLPGRGQSDWLPDPSLYVPATYVGVLGHILSACRQPVAWIGTSLGGICGMLISAMPGAPIGRLVLNDIGPHIPAAALARIREYVEPPPAFPTMHALEAHLRRVHAPFGRLTDTQWAHLAQHSARALADGTFALHYDPAIATPILASEPQDLDLSSAWDAISIPILAIRGEQSDLLHPDVHGRMARKAQTLIVPQAGHAPALMDAPTIEAITKWLQ